jgi:hypothetical protein
MVPARASSSRKPKPPKRFADEALAVVIRRPRGKAASASGKRTTKANAVRKARRITAPTSRKKKNAAAAAEDDDDQCADEPDQDTLAEDEAEELAALLADEEPGQRKRRNRVAPQRAAEAWEEGDPEFVGDPVPSDEARAAFPERYMPVAAAAAKRYVRCRAPMHIIYSTPEYVHLPYVFAWKSCAECCCAGRARRRRRRRSRRGAITVQPRWKRSCTASVMMST